MKHSDPMSWATRLFVIASLLGATCAVCHWNPSFAGTTGEIQGFVADATLHPLGGAGVTAVAPSGRATATTDASGFYSLVGLPPDTYTVTFSKDGYLTQTVLGVTAIQDQSVRVDAQLQIGIKTLAHVNARSSASLLQPTVTANTYVVSQKRLSDINGTPQDLNGFQALNSLPGVNADAAGNSTIRAGALNDIAYLYDGVDNTDEVVHAFINAFSLNGTRSFQLSTGGYDVSDGNSTTGVINQVIMRGSYPPHVQATVRIAGPIFEHELAFDYGSASPNNRFSYYLAFGGQNDAIAYGDRIATLPLKMGNLDFNASDDDV